MLVGIFPWAIFMQHNYLLLAEQLATDIRSGIYPVNTRLPSVRQLTGIKSVSASTVMRCYRHLEHLGYVQGRQRSGYFVADWKPLQSQRQRGREAVQQPAQPVAYDKLMSLQHRMTQLYSLTQKPVRLGLHLATAAAEWYPVDSLSRIGQRVLRREPSLFGTYPSGTGLPTLKTALARQLAACGVDIAEQDLLITHGSTEALGLALRAVAKPGDSIAVESPVYFGLLQMLENLGLKAIEIPCVPEIGISLEALDFALTHNRNIRAVVAMPSFQNPLGCTMSERRKRELLRLVIRHHVVLIEDDVFGDLTPLAERPQPVKAWDSDGSVIYCGSCSKSLAPGLRLGWVAGGKRHVELESIKVSQSLATPLLDQAVLAEYMLTDGMLPHLRKLRERISAQLSHALAAVQRYFPLGTKVISTAGGWWLWLALPEPFDTLTLLKECVAQGVAFTPGALFSGEGRFGNYLRINIGRPWTQEMDHGFRTVGNLATLQLQAGQ